jgi:hypothetical protein
MAEPLTREDLDPLQCQHPDCNHKDHRYVYLAGMCHRQAPLYARYDRVHGILEMICARCSKLVLRIQVAE